MKFFLPRVPLLAITTIATICLASCEKNKFSAGTKGKSPASQETAPPSEEPPTEAEETTSNDSPEENSPETVEPATDVGATKKPKELETKGDPVVDTSAKSEKTQILTDVVLSPAELQEIGELSTEERKKRQLVKDFQVSKRSFFYVVTRTGHIYYFVLNGKNLLTEESRHWTYKHTGTGIRTYVTEGGLVFTNNGGKVYFVDPQTQPNNSALDETVGGKNHWVIPGTVATDRTCVVSYLLNGKRYIGMAHGIGKFTELALEDNPPHRPLWTITRQASGLASSQWGYSCFINQKAMTYASQWANALPPSGINLTNLTAILPEATASNGTFKSTTITSFVGVKGPQGGSYSIAADSEGNAYNGSGKYTYAADRAVPYVWASTAGSSILEVYPKECLTNKPDCTGAVKVINTSAAGSAKESMGPLSALQGGGIIALVRSSPNAYLWELDENKNPQFTRLDTKILGDPYMYTDFTGATLYREAGDLIFDLKENTVFDAQKSVRLLAFLWSNQEGAPASWEDIGLQIRCYKLGEPPPAFSEITNVRSAGSYTFVLSGSCRKANIDRAELKLTQLNGKTTMTRIKDLTLSFFQ